MALNIIGYIYWIHQVNIIGKNYIFRYIRQWALSFGTVYIATFLSLIFWHIKKWWYTRQIRSCI
jgi:hypothetical protein